MNRIKIEFAYDGEKFYGFQSLPDKRTVQNELEKALTKLLGEDIKIVASGRTDAGVSALKQVAHFDTNSSIIATNICFAVNKLLPKDIQVFSSKKVSDNFHARFSAKLKVYKYLVYNSVHLNPVYEKSMLQVSKKLDLEKMKIATRFLIGKHDFSAFASKDDERKNCIRDLKNIEIYENNGIFEFILTGNAFLYNMVRIIVGTLIDVGVGNIDPKKVDNILKSKERKFAGKLVSAHALTLVDVKY